MTFEVGQVYNRKSEIHEVYGGQRQGGISTPTNQPMIFLFTSEAGEGYGYEDRFHEDGTFRYTGEGQVGDMEMVRGNAAVRDHASNGKTLCLFEYVKKGYVRFVAEATYIGHHYEQRPDRDGRFRQAVIFELDLDGMQTAPVRILDPAVAAVTSQKTLWKKSLSEVRELAVEKSPSEAETSQRRIAVRLRSEAVKIYVLRRANGYCECCGKPAPFLRKSDHRPYLEPHHIHRMADGGPDHPEFVAAICPNCHREVHYGEHGEEMNQQLGEKTARLERSL